MKSEMKSYVFDKQRLRKLIVTSRHTNTMQQVEHKNQIGPNEKHRVQLVTTKHQKEKKKQEQTNIENNCNRRQRRSSGVMKVGLNECY